MTKRLTAKMLQEMVREELNELADMTDKTEKLDQIEAEDAVRKAVAPLLKAISKFETDCPQSLMSHVQDSLETLWSTLTNAYERPVAFTDTQRITPSVKNVKKRFTVAKDII